MIDELSYLWTRLVCAFRGHPLEYLSNIGDSFHCRCGDRSETGAAILARASRS